MNPQLKNPKFYLMIVSDVCLFAAALCLSYLLRFEFTLDNIYVAQIPGLLLWIVPLKLLIFFAGGLYRGMWRYTSVRDFWRLAKACLLATILVMLIILLAKGFMGYPRSVFIADGIFTFLLSNLMQLIEFVSL